MEKKDEERISKRLYLFLQLVTLMSAQAEELERELRGVGAFKYDTKHMIKRIQEMARKLWDSRLFTQMTPEQLGLFGKDGENFENLINGLLFGRVKSVEYELNDEKENSHGDNRQSTLSL